MGKVSRFALTAGLALTASACTTMPTGTTAASPTPTDGPVALRTFHMTGSTCSLMPVRGTLVADPIWGLALLGKDESGAPHRYGVVWPDEYSARWDHGIVVLLHLSGNLVAREGDRVVLDGERQDPIYTCSDVSIERT
jgi:hypothetical protein